MLKFALTANAAFSGLSGLTLTVAGTWIAPVIGVGPGWAYHLTGVMLLGFAASLFANANRPAISIAEVKLAIALDLAWVIGSALLLTFRSGSGLTATGFWVVLAVAVVVADAAAGQAVGLVRAARENSVA